MADLIGPLLSTFLACAVAELDPAPDRAYVSPGGPVVWDDCCVGQAWTRLISQVPIQPQFCGVTGWNLTIGVGILRCAAVVNDQGNAPPVAALTADAMQMCTDAHALAVAIQCCMAPVASRLTVLSWAPLGPDGGCVGGEWQLTVLLEN